MNGFVLQETNFPFVCIIVDDASTDGEQEIIKNYLHAHFNFEDKTVVRNAETDDYFLTYAQHKTNKNCFFAVLFLKYNHYSIKKPKKPYLSELCDTKYTAVNEGDDYWTDRLKLQKQYDLMEAHPEYSMCFHANDELFPNGEKQVHKPSVIKPAYTIEDAILGGGAFMASNSMFYRNEYLRNEPIPEFWKNCPIGDLPTMLFWASKGFLGYIDDVMSVYRRSLVGSWTGTMNSSFKRRNKHYHAIKKMWTQFDEYSDYHYHSSVMKKIRINKKEHYRYEVLTFLLKIKDAVRRIVK